eukprot:7237760-Heterocapsa_arctica.AAC.1
MGSQAATQVLQSLPHGIHGDATGMEWIHAQELLQSVHVDRWNRAHEEMHEQDHVDDEEQRPLQEAREQ